MYCHRLSRVVNQFSEVDMAKRIVREILFFLLWPSRKKAVLPNYFSGKSLSRLDGLLLGVYNVKRMHEVANDEGYDSSVSWEGEKVKAFGRVLIMYLTLRNTMKIRHLGLPYSESWRSIYRGANTSTLSNMVVALALIWNICAGLVKLELVCTA